MSTVENMFLGLVEQSKSELRSLLVDYKDRPRFRVGNEDYTLGLIDSQPMLVRDRDKSFFKPEAVAAKVTGFKWRTKP